MERYFEQYGKQKSELTGSTHFLEVIHTIFALAEDVVVPPAVRQKACDTILRYSIGLPVQRIDMTTLGEKMAQPPINMTITSATAEGAVQRIINGDIAPDEPANDTGI
jgi:hypothetical protein